MKKIILSAVAGVLMMGLTQSAAANADLAKAKGCLACHTADKKLVGPAYKDVAAKYAGQKGVESTLVAKIKSGGKGVWGEVAMAPNPTLGDDDAKTLAKWILSGAK